MRRDKPKNKRLLQTTCILVSKACIQSLYPKLEFLCVGVALILMLASLLSYKNICENVFCPRHSTHFAVNAFCSQRSLERILQSIHSTVNSFYSQRILQSIHSAINACCHHRILPSALLSTVFRNEKSLRANGK